MRTATTAIYARVSTTDQHCEMQLTELREYAARAGWEIVKEYVDRGFSGMKRDRPAFVELMKDAAMRRFNAVLVWKLDRFGRSLQHLVENIQELERLGIRFVAPSQAIDTDRKSPAGKLLLNILASVAEFERDLIQERVNGGLKQYRRDFEAGKVGKVRQSRSGKNLPIGRPRKIFRRDEAIKLRAAGLSWRALERKLGVPQATIRAALGVQKPVLPAA